MPSGKIVEKNIKAYAGVLCAVLIFLITLLASAFAPVSAYASGGGSNPLRLTVNQIFTISGDTTVTGLTGSTFRYQLTPLTAGSPLPKSAAVDGYTFDIEGTDSLELAPISFLQQGIFRYKLAQLIDVEKSGYTYDKRVYTLEAHVDNTGAVWLVVKNEAGDKVGELSFVNSYKEPVAAPEGGQTPPPDQPSVFVKPPEEDENDSDAEDGDGQNAAVTAGTNPSTVQFQEKPPVVISASEAGMGIDEGENISVPVTSLQSVVSQIMSGNVPLGGVLNRKDWSLLSALLSLVGLVSVIRLTVSAAWRYWRKAEKSESAGSVRLSLLARIFGLLTPICWVVLDWPLYNMVWVNHWTPVVALVFAAHVVLLVLRKRWRPDTLDLQ